MERKISEIPERWMVLKIVTSDTLYKVFGSWAGGYLGEDRWRINSGISRVEEDEDNYYFYGFSGSCYKCKKGSYGVVGGIARATLSKMLENGSVKVEVLDPEYEFVNIESE